MSTDESTGEAGGLPKIEEIICVSRRASPSTGDLVYEVLSLKQEENDGRVIFTLSQSTPYSEPPSLPEGLLDELLVVADSNGSLLPLHLRPDSSHRVHVLVSTGSGTAMAMQFYDEVLAKLLLRLGLRAGQETETFRLVVTQSAESVGVFARGLAAAGDGELEHTVVLLSGDGGVVDMLNGTAAASADDTPHGKEPLLAIIPLGTGNALFNSLHKTVTLPAASVYVQGLRTLLRGRPAALPSFKATFPPGSRSISYHETSGLSIDPTDEPSDPPLVEESGAVSHLHGVVVASYGFHSQLVWESDTPAHRRHGAARFGMAAQELLKESHVYQTKVQIVRSTSSSAAGGQNPRRPEAIALEGDGRAYVLATLVSNLEKTFCISPASKPLDGQLRLVHFGAVDGKRTMEIMMAAYADGKHVGMRWADGEDERGVGYEAIDEVRITTLEEDPRWRKVCIDGTIVEIPVGGCVVVRREAARHLRVLISPAVPT